MTIEELRMRKSMLEHQINNLIKQFADETDIEITKLSLSDNYSYITKHRSYQKLIYIKIEM